MDKVRWGVLSTATIGTGKVIPAMQRCAYGEVVGMASRKLETARQTAARMGIPQAYGSYEELLADPDIDAVYIPLPNHLHVAWSIKALEAGKHVLCEKPIALTADEAGLLVAAAAQHPDRKVMEAFMYRHHPQWQRARQIVAEGGIGRVQTIQTFFSYYLDDPANIRNMAAIGGGALMDIGCYAISVPRFIFDAEPQRVSGLMDYDPQFRTDRLVSAMLDFGATTATFTCGTQLTPYQRVNIFGSAGRVEIEIPFNAPPDRPCRMWHQQGDEITEIALDICDQYTIQADLFARAVLDNTPVPTPLADAVANMRVIDAVRESARTGAWVTPGRESGA
jgi:predicted dehydrogenase